MVYITVHKLVSNWKVALVVLVIMVMSWKMIACPVEVCIKHVLRRY